MCKEHRVVVKQDRQGIICRRCDIMLNGRDQIEPVKATPMRAG